MDEIKAVVDNATPQTVPKSTPAQTPPPADKPKGVIGRAESWGDPILFGTVAATPEISPALLPGVFGEFAQSLTDNLQTPPAMAVMYSLAVLSTALQRKFVVAPYDDGGYTEPVHVWVLIIAESGERKSQVIERLTRPLTFWERRRLDRERVALAENESIRRICLKRAEKLENDAAKEDDPDGRTALAKEAAELKASMPEERFPPQLWTGDVTPEELQDRLAKCGGKMAVLSDEPALFSVLAGVYSGGEAVLDVFLQAYSGRDVRVNRRSRSAIIERPALTLGLAVQPGILSDFPPTAKRKFRASGLFARFFPIYPVSRVGRRNVRQRVVIPDELQRTYDRAVMALLDIESPDGQEFRLILDEEAREVWLAFAEDIERGQGDGGNLEGIKDSTAKLPGGALRVAGLLHIAEHGEAGTDLRVKKATMLRAVTLAWEVVEHAQAVFSLVGTDKSIDDAKTVWAWIDSNRLTGFLRSECHRKFHCKFGKVEELVAALEILKGRGLIRGPIAIKGTNGGRPGHAYEVNPAALSRQEGG
jgi:hypothetical protein